MNTIDMKWKDSYRFNDALIDRQHQEIFTMAHSVVNAADQSAFKLAVKIKSLSVTSGLNIDSIIQEVVKGHWNRDDVHSFMAHGYWQHVEEEDAKIAAHNRMFLGEVTT